MSIISIQRPEIARAASGAAVGRPASRTSALSRGPIVRTTFRLTRRGHRVLTAIAAAPLVALIAFSVIAGGSALASGKQSTPVSFETVTVMPGETLWSIAVEAAPGIDTRVVIDDIMSLNNLSTGFIQAGSEIAIPAQYSH